MPYDYNSLSDTLLQGTGMPLRTPAPTGPGVFGSSGIPYRPGYSSPPVSGFGSSVVAPYRPGGRTSLGMPSGFGSMGMFGSMSGGGGGGIDEEAAAAAERERAAALGLLDPSAVLNDPYSAAASSYYRSVLSGNALPYGEKQKNLMYSRQTDEIAAAQDAARRAATRRAASMGLGRGAALASQLRAGESEAAAARQGARSDIENQATMANLQARQFAASGLGNLFGTRQSLANQLRSQQANLRANTQYRGGAGGSGSRSSTRNRQSNFMRGTIDRGVFRGRTTGLRSIGGML